MPPLAALRTPADAGGSVSLSLHTQTPLYTGGSGQYGDQIHPSSLLGGLRRFSCLLAAAVGDADFEHAVWGTVPAPNNPHHHAKQIGLRVDTSGLQTIRPVAGQGCVNWPRSDGVARRGWFYNVAQEGQLGLTFTRRGISDRHWQLLLLALRIQINHATFGAKDQFGLGVLDAELPPVEPLQPPPGGPLPNRPNLQDAFFAQVEFSCPAPPDWQARLEQGLRWREHLRGNFRPGNNNLRHYLFGKLGQFGSAINISALYPHGNDCALRIWGVLPHTRSIPAWFAGQRATVVGTIRTALTGGPAGVLPGMRPPVWQDGAAHQADFAHWINQLAGVSA
ncbi:MAG: hypothetical protein KDI73_07140 [Candidatus Competibacteraceae bacterium]|nr:hypothetical protein [Candidatus Competibacteraceae bacterium]